MNKYFLFCKGDIVQKKNLTLVSMLCLSLFLGSCASKEAQKQIPRNNHLKISLNAPSDNFNTIVTKMTQELIADRKIPLRLLGPVAITSFVDLHVLDKTTHFGQLLSENFMSELYAQGIDIVDFRARKFILVNKKGEFLITRNKDKIKKKLNYRYIFVGTYSSLGKEIMLNARIIDNTNGELVASARAVYSKAPLKYLNEITKEEKKKNALEPKMLRIVSGKDT